jgi:hypothetical protein
VERSLHRTIEAMDREHEETNCHCRQLEIILLCQKCQIEELDRKLQEQMNFHNKKKNSKWKKVEKA